MNNLKFNLGVLKFFFKDYNEAFKNFTECARYNGNLKTVSEAKHNLGFLYYYGIGTTKNLTSAFNLYKESAEQGNDGAQYDLAHMYASGKGTLKNLKKAFYWFKKSAEQDNMSAQLFLGLSYDNGDGTLKDLKKALFWYKKSAENGEPYGQYLYGLFLIEVQSNKKEGAIWIKKAYESGVEDAEIIWNKYELWKY